MTADSYDAWAETGTRLEEPSEKDLFGLLSELDAQTNTFVTITAAPDSNRQAVVSRREDGSYQVERYDARQGWQEVRTESAATAIARDLTGWFAD
jgi:hypothetical protein